jgi:glycosyltransferase involved in cell wall biosynthesis
VPHKGVDLLIDAFRRLSTTARPVDLHIHGDETRSVQYAEKLRQLAAGHPRIRFAGRYDNHEVEGILSRIDVVVVPSIWFEVRPLVIMEAFAARVPVVAARLPNMEYQVRDGVDGLLFAPGDPNDLARQLQRLVDEPDLVRRLGKNVEPVRTVDQEMAETESIYRSVMTKPRATEAESRPALRGQPI